MKTVISTIIILFLTAYVYADCESNGLSVFPTGKTLRQNSIIVIEGYGDSQTIISDLNKKYPVYLKSGEKKVCLKVIETCIGQYHLTQAVLKPDTLLEAGLDYEIQIDNLPEFESLNRYNSETKEWEPIKFKVTSGNDTEEPFVSSIPKETEKKLYYYGCGPSTHVVFKSVVKDSSEIIIKTTVTNMKSGIECTYYIQPNKNKIEVGHGMCSGAFIFDDGLKYEVSFSFMDASGNMTNWKGKKIKFTKPTRQSTDNE